MDEKWKIFDIRFGYFDSVGKAQSRYVHILVTLLFVVWTWNVLSTGGEVTVQVLGVTLRASGFWQATPFVLTAIILPLIGTINLTHHAWRLLDKTVESLGVPMFFVELDRNQNYLDYLGYITTSLTRPPLPESIAEGEGYSQKGDLRVLLYPALVLLSIFTTSYSLRKIPVSWASSSYVLLCVLLQGLFALPFMWRKVCLFVGVHKNAYQGMTWASAPKVAG